MQEIIKSATFIHERSGKIWSTHEALSDFFIRPVGPRFIFGIPHRWFLFWGDLTIGFAEINVNEVVYGHLYDIEITSDGRRSIVINQMGMSDKYTSGG